MSRKEIVELAAETLKKNNQGSTAYELAAFALHMAMPNLHLEALLQLVNGPIYDGDLVSKSARDKLLEWGLATKVCVKGEQGFNGANYRGWDVLKTGI